MLPVVSNPVDISDISFCVSPVDRPACERTETASKMALSSPDSAMFIWSKDVACEVFKESAPRISDSALRFASS